MLTLKHYFQKNWLEINAQRILVLSENAPKNLQENLIIYLFDNSKLMGDKVLEILETLPLIIKETVMSTLDIFIEKGKKEGVDQTLHKNTLNMLLKGFSIDIICEVLEVTPEYVIKIRNESNT